MPRPKRFRKIQHPPGITGFVPIADQNQHEKPVVLLYEEYDAIRMVDYQNYSHAEAAQKMDVSRPTFTRIYNSARKAIAKAFVESKPLFFHGNKQNEDGYWYSCQACNNQFFDKQVDKTSCPDCDSDSIEIIATRAARFFCEYCQKLPQNKTKTDKIECINCHIRNNHY